MVLYPCSPRVTICMGNLPQAFHFQPICVFGFKVNFLWIMCSQTTCLIHSAKFSLDCGLILLYLKWLLIKRELLLFCYLVSLCLIVCLFVCFSVSYFLHYCLLLCLVDFFLQWVVCFCYHFLLCTMHILSFCLSGNVLPSFSLLGGSYFF